MKKIFIPILCVLMLCGCAMRPDTNNTNSNNTTGTTVTESTTESVTEPTADPVAGVESLSTKKVIWGCGNITDHQQPQEPLNLQKEYFDMDAHWLLDDEKQVCLTFDEGYENGFTPAILDTLKEKKVKAIFFVTYDFASQNRDLIARMLKEGHTVGNHSYRHYAMDELDVSTAREEVTFLHRYLQENFNYTMSYFRFPKGEFSEQSLGIVHELGYTSVFWSYAYADWDPAQQPEQAQALQKLCDSTHPGAIILLHAVSETNAAILGDAIDKIRAQGYEFTTAL